MEYCMCTQRVDRGLAERTFMMSSDSIKDCNNL